MKCRKECAACCIAPSLSTPLPSLPEGKPAGVTCPHLDGRMRCRLFYDPERPKVCHQLRPSFEMCGTNRESALRYLQWLEEETRI